MIHMMTLSRLGLLAATCALCVAACKEDPPPPQYPQQPYPPQPYPQPYQQPPPPAPAPAPLPPPAPAPAPTGTGAGAIPGVEKKADGTCWITPPALGNQPAQPIQLPACPPGM